MTTAERPGPIRNSQTGRALFFVGLILVAGFALRLVQLGEKSLWVDEGATWVLSQRPLPDILEDSGDREHPPGYYALIHFSSRVSDSEAALRFPSVVASTLAILLVYLLGRRMADHRVGIAAAALLALSPLDLWYAQEARQPVFAGLAVVAAGLALARGRWLGVTASALLLALGLYLDFITAVGWMAFGGIWVVIWVREDRRKVLDWLGVTFAAALVYAPFQGREFIDGFSGLLGHQGAGVWYGEILGSNPVTSSPFGLLALGGAVTAGIFALGRAITRSPRGGNIWAAAIVAGFAVGSALTAVPRAYSVKKVIVVGWPIVTLLVAYLLVERVARGQRRPLMIGAVIALAVGSLATFAVPKDDWRSATATVNERSEPGDVVWVRPDPWAADAYFYYQGEAPVRYADEPSPDPSVRDVWMITYRRPQDTPPSMASEKWFDDNWRLVEEYPVHRLSVRHYTRP